MLCSRLTDPGLLAQGVFEGSRLNPFVGSLSVYGTPAIVADIDPSSATLLSGSQVLELSTTIYGNTYGVSNGWTTEGEPAYLLSPWLIQDIAVSPLASTSTPGDFIQISTTAYAVDIQTTPVTYGGIIHVAVDSQPSLSISGYTPQTTPYRVYLDGQSHTIRLSIPGDVQTIVPILDSPQDVSGTPGLAISLGLRQNGTPFTTPGTWTFSGNVGNTSISIYNPSSTLVGSLNVSSVTDSLIPGTTLSLSSGTWDSTSTASLHINSPEMSLDSFTFYNRLSMSALYQTPVLDSQDSGTEWPIWELEEGGTASAVPNVSIYLSDDSVSWSSYSSLEPYVYPDPLGGNFQRIVFAMPRGAVGRYAAVVGHVIGQPQAWVSNIRVWSWNPITDPFLTRLPPEIALTPRMYEFLTALSAIASYEDELADEYTSSVAISSSYGKYLSLYGEQFSLPRLVGEPDSAYRLRVSGLLSGRRVGGSKPFLQTTLSGALGCPVVVDQVSRTGSSFTLGSGVLGRQSLGNSSYGYWRWTCTIPLAQLKIPVEQAIEVINFFLPVASIVSILFV